MTTCASILRELLDAIKAKQVGMESMTIYGPVEPNTDAQAEWQWHEEWIDRAKRALAQEDA